MKGTSRATNQTVAIMEKTAEQLAYEAENIEFELANALSPDIQVINGKVVHTTVQKETHEIKRLRHIQAQIIQEKILLKKSVNSNDKAVTVEPCARRSQNRRGRGEGARSSAASGDGNPDPEPARPIQLLDQSSLADLLGISKKTLQNLYSSTPHLLPQAISVPGARGPRWTAASVQSWLQSRSQHIAKPAPRPAKRKAGRPRIALAVGGGRHAC